MDIASKLSCLILVLISGACSHNDKPVQLQSSSPDTSQKIIHATSIVGQWQLSNTACKWDLLVYYNGTYMLNGNNFPMCANNRIIKTLSSGKWYGKNNYYFLSSSDEVNKLYDKKIKGLGKPKKNLTPSTIDTLYWSIDKARFFLENDSLFMLDSKDVRDSLMVFTLKR